MIQNGARVTSIFRLKGSNGAGTPVLRWNHAPRLTLAGARE